jgi:hypothetical protein
VLHLKCTEEKPCKRCQKRTIPCRVTPAPAVDGRNKNGGAKDLLRLAQGGNSHVPHTDSSVPREDRKSNADSFPSNSSAFTAPINQSNLEPSPALFLTPQTPIQAGFTEGTLDATAVNASRSSPSADDVPPIMDLPAFLRGSMPTGYDQLSGPSLFHHSRSVTPRGLINFGLETNLELDDMDLSFLDAYNLKIPFDLDFANEDSSQGREQDGDAYRVAIGSEAFRKSIWHFIPVPQDHTAAEQPKLSLPIEEDAHDSPESRIDLQRRTTPEKLHQSVRDKILAMVLSTCKPANVSRCAASFPSVELLDKLLQYFLTTPSARAGSWLHIPSLQLGRFARSEVLAAMIAAGAVLTPDAALRKLGFAIQEALRHIIPTLWEEDNSTTRDLSLLQGYMLLLEIGLWSGNSRKIEIAESFQQPISTILRRGGKFRRSSYTPIIPRLEDNGEVLQNKWKAWIEQESFKRLVFHIFQHDAWTSMALLVNPIISYAELSLPLPCPQDLWLAPDAETWQSIYLAQTKIPGRIPSIMDCVNDLENLTAFNHHIDRTESRLAFLYAAWGMVWEYRQLVSKLTDRSFLMKGRQQELVQILEHFRFSINETTGGSSRTTFLLLELIHMHLYMTLEDVQLFAGLEGQEEVSRVFPLLRDWVKTTEARRALWHAGQLVRFAKSLPSAFLRDFYAVGVYHASLAFWTYGLMLNSAKQVSHEAEGTLHESIVWLDETKTTEVQRFITIGRGSPALRGLSTPHTSANTVTFLRDASATMNLVIHIFRSNSDPVEASSPPLVANLIQLMGSLQNTAKASII